MLVVSPVEFEKSPSKYCEMAAKDSVFVKYAGNYIKLAFIKQLPRRPKNPNNPSPSGDVWFDDPKNLAIVENGIKNIGKEKGILITGEQELRKFFDGL